MTQFPVDIRMLSRFQTPKEAEVALDKAADLYAFAAKLPGLEPAGLQAYDGHNNQEPRAEREAAVKQFLGRVLELRDVPGYSPLWGAINRAGIERNLRLALEPAQTHTLP